MNVQENYDDKAERLNTHPDLLPPADDEDQILATNNAVLVKALKQQVAPHKATSDSVVLKSRVVTCKASRNNLALIKALKKRVAPRKALETDKKTDYVTVTETFSTRTTDARVMIL